MIADVLLQIYDYIETRNINGIVVFMLMICRRRVDLPDMQRDPSSRVTTSIMLCNSEIVRYEISAIIVHFELQI